jgi:sugar (glycoside-pentoside-hexuronide) transporter
MGGALIFAFSSYYLLSYFTDVALIPAGAIAIIMMLYRLTDAIDDQVLALLINRKSFKQGKYRPYFLLLCVPFAIVSCLIYYSSGFADSEKIVYAFVTLVVWEMLYTILNMSASAMLPYITKDVVERAALNSIRVVFSVAAFLIISLFGMQMIEWFGNTISRLTGSTNAAVVPGWMDMELGASRIGFTLTALVLGLASIPMHLMAYFNINERYYPKNDEAASIKTVFLAIVKNRRLLSVMVMFVFYWLAAQIRNQMAVFYISNNIGRSDLISLILTVGILASFFMNMAIPLIIKRVRREECIFIGLLLGALLMLLLLPAGTSIAALVVITVLYGVVSALPATLVYLVTIDLIDDIREQNNLNVSEVYFSALNFSSKIGMTIAGGLCPIVMGMTGYNPLSGTQSATALAGIQILYIGGTALFLLLSAIMAFKLIPRKERSCE